MTIKEKEQLLDTLIKKYQVKVEEIETLTITHKGVVKRLTKLEGKFEKTINKLVAKEKAKEKKFENAKFRLNKIIELEKTVVKRVTDLDKLLLQDLSKIAGTDLSKLYGFDKTEMYYIGAASGHVYRKLIDKRIVEMIGNIKRCTDEHKREINCHFMDIEYKKL